MNHFYYDGFGGYRTRFDDLKLVQEFLEEVPVALGLRPAMPPFLLPYYNGVVPDDCGISSFVFLSEGHATLHTFSFREAIFFDLLAPSCFDSRALRDQLAATFPCKAVAVGNVRRGEQEPNSHPFEPSTDFGPHFFLDLESYTGPATLDGLFAIFDRLPSEIGMTPIMRPYVMRNELESGESVVSAMTMIAESHISIHVFPERQKAFFDLFSCRYFDPQRVLPVIRRSFPGTAVHETLTVRGSQYRKVWTDQETEIATRKSWLDMVSARTARR